MARFWLQGFIRCSNICDGRSATPDRIGIGVIVSGCWSKEEGLEVIIRMVGKVRRRRRGRALRMEDRLTVSDWGDKRDGC